MCGSREPVTSLSVTQPVFHSSVAALEKGVVIPPAANDVTVEEVQQDLEETIKDYVLGKPAREEGVSLGLEKPLIGGLFGGLSPPIAA
jgi:hypothetical protein